MIAIAASMMMVLGLGTAMADDTITLRLSNNQPDGNVTTQACEWFAEQVKERTNGRIEIQVYNNGTLGDAVSSGAGAVWRHGYHQGRPFHDDQLCR